MLAAVRSATLVGVDGQPVTVEVHVSSGLPAYHGRRAPRRRGARVARARPGRAAVVGARRGPMQRITVNLAPGGVRKTGLRPRARGRARAARRGRRAARRGARRRRRARRARARRLGARRYPARSRSSTRSRATASTSVIVPLANAGRGRARAPACTCARRARSPSCGACLKGEESWPDVGRRPPEPDDDADVDDEPVDLARGARPRVRAARARGRRRRRAPPAVRRPTGNRQDHARPPAPHHPPAARPRRGARGHAHPLGRGRAVARPARSRARPFRAPHHTASTAVARRRRQRAAAARRGHARAPRRCCSSTSSASSRRPRSTRCANRSRSASCASRASTPRSRSRPSFQLVACTNPCPCGLGEPDCRCTRGPAGPLPPAPERAAPRPLRPARACHRRPNHATSPASRRRRVASASSRAVARQRARYADWPWSAERARRPRAWSTGSLPLDADAADAWRDLIEGRVLTGRGAARIRRVARTLADLDDAPDDHRRAPRDRGAAPERRAVSRPQALAAAHALDPRRARGRRPRVPPRHDPGAAARRCSPAGAARSARSRAVRRGPRGVRCSSPRAGPRTSRRGSLARLWQWRVAADDDRVPGTLAAPRSTASSSTVASGYPIDDDVPGRPPVLLAEGDAPARARPAARRGRRHARGHAARPGRRARDRRGARATPASRSSAGSRSASTPPRTRARSTPAARVVGVVATGLDVVYPRRHAALFRRVRARRVCS